MTTTDLSPVFLKLIVAIGEYTGKAVLATVEAELKIFEKIEIVKTNLAV